MGWKFWKRSGDMPAPDQPDWERALINRMALEYLRDQRRRWRWGMFFKVLVLLYLIGLLIVAYSGNMASELSASDPHVAVVDVKGIISADSDASAKRVNEALEKAFDNDKVKGVILRINSPGGSPVQAGEINREITRLKAAYHKKHGRDLPVYAVAEDLCASGAYFVAVAADDIYADPASLVGSIGVRLDSFGFDQVMQKIGVERRLLTAGENKGILDPFLPLPDSQRQFVMQVLENVHQQFIQAVKDGRGNRLKGGDELFSGLFWSGQEAVKLGLVDGLGSVGEVARDKLGTDKLVDYTRKRDLFESVAKRFGAAFAAALGENLEGSVQLR